MRHIQISHHYRSSQSGGDRFGNPFLSRLLIKWLCLTGAVLCADYLLEGISTTGFASAIFAAAALGVLNMFFRPLLLILTLPINIMSLGLFTFVINALMLKMATGLIDGFTVTGFWTAVFGALLISIVNWTLTALIQENRMYEYSEPDGKDDDFIDLNKRNGRWG